MQLLGNMISPSTIVDGIPMAPHAFTSSLGKAQGGSLSPYEHALFQHHRHRRRDASKLYFRCAKSSIVLFRKSFCNGVLPCVAHFCHHEPFKHFQLMVPTKILFIATK